MIKNIVFDVGKVLVTFEPEKHLVNLGYDERTRKKVMEAMFLHPLWNENDRGIMTDEELLAGFISNAPECEMQIREAFNKIEKTIELMPYSLGWVRELKEKGYHLYIISNYGEYTYQQTKHKLEFLPYMDGVIFSFQYKMIKPDEVIYKKLLELYQLQAEECVFIDDSLPNVEAAKKVGFQAIQLQNYERTRQQLGKLLESV